MGVTRRAVLGSAAVLRRGLRAIGRTRRRVRRSRPDEHARMVLAVTQSGTSLTLEMVTGVGLELGAIAARLSDGTRIAVTRPTSTPLGRAGALRGITGPVGGFDGVRHEAVLDLAEVARRARSLPIVEDVSLDVEVTSTQSRLPRYATLIERAAGERAAGDATIRYWAPIGRFRRTRIEVADRIALDDGLTARLRVTKWGHLLVAFAPGGAEEVRVDTREITVDGATVTVTGVLRCGSPEVGAARLELAGRDIPVTATGEATLSLDRSATERAYGRRRYRFTASLDLRDLIVPRATLPPHAIADLALAVEPTVGADPVRRRVGRIPFEHRHAVTPTRVIRHGIVLEVVPYFTFKGRNASMMLDRFELPAYRYMQQRLRAPEPTTPPGPPVWIVGERPDTAQDNGLALFRYLRTERRDIDAYYVITRDSPDRHHLSGLDHVVTFGSIEHIDLTLRAERIVTTHHADYLYPSRTPRFQRRVTAARVFLQHGVMGTKWMVPNYGKFGTGFVTDLFCVSSERERDYIIHDFGYRPDEVVVTGLARFDTLFADDIARRPGHVLVAPTWRDWLTDTAAFDSSDYLAQWRGLLEDPRVADAVARHGGRVTLYLHSNMRKYADHFHIDGVTLVGPGEARLQDLVKQSSVLVTDYSSTGFDAAFLDRPVIYFQFDRERFLGRPGSHLHLDDELPGTVTHTVDETIARLGTVLGEGFTLEEEFRRRAARFLDHHDRGSCARIVRAVIGARRRPNRIEAVRRLDAVHTIERRARRSRLYFPLMRRAYRMMRWLPIDPGTIVFEAGIGRQFNDSPRAIYEELVARGDPRRRVWIYPRTLPVDDPQLVIVKRFSPRYFYYLARAKYWVNNQNFPHYITRRRRGVYVQTWHGTPIKRMLHDLDRIVGRDSGYLRRVTEAVSQWSVLLSPSPYATEAFRSAFHYRGKVLEAGYPRNDILIGADTTERRRAMRERLGVRDDQRVLLYAPTFRDNQKKKGAFSFVLPFDLDRFAERFGPETVLLLRMHLLVAEATTISDAARSCVKDVSSHSDIADLYLAADALVTDYSSVMFDFGITGKPMIFYPYDLEEYRDEVRGFYLDYERDLPGTIARTEDELFAAIDDLDMSDGADHPDVRAIAARFAPFDDGHAAARVVDAVFGPEP